MKRLTLVGPYPPPWGGIAVHMQAIERLARRRGIAVRVFDTGEEHHRRSGENEVFRGGGVMGVAAAVRGAHGAPVHVHISGNNAKAWLLALSLGRPFRRSGPGAVLTVHSGLVPSFLGERAHRELARAACIGFNRIFCTNEGIAAALQGCGVAPERLEVLEPFLPEPTDLRELPAEVLRLRERCRPLLVAAMAEGPQYGLEVLLGSLDLVASRHPSMGLVLFGPRVERIVPRERLGSLGNRAVVLGELEHGLARSLIASADIFLRPTLADGDSVSVREALSLGVRVVASDVGRRPAEVALFRAGDRADLARAVDLSLSLPAPAPGSGMADASARLLSAWEGVGLRVEGGKG